MRAAVAILCLFLLTACNESQDEQNRFKTYTSSRGSEIWPSQGEALTLVPGTVPQGALERERELKSPPAASLALLQRGRERYDIYCAPCHGLAGNGDGIIVARGFPRPAPFSDPGQMHAPAKHLVDVISNGYGRMYSFSDRVEPRDRWAIAAYIRALQLAGQSRQSKS